MDFTVEKKERSIAISGQIDSVNSIAFEEALNSAANHYSEAMEIDCTGLEYISSSGLRVFIALQKRFNSEAKSMFVSNLQPHIREIFDMTGFSKIIALK